MRPATTGDEGQPAATPVMGSHGGGPVLVVPGEDWMLSPRTLIPRTGEPPLLVVPCEGWMSPAAARQLGTSLHPGVDRGDARWSLAGANIHAGESFEVAVELASRACSCRDGDVCDRCDGDGREVMVTWLRARFDWKPGGRFGRALIVLPLVTSGGSTDAVVEVDGERPCGPRCRRLTGRSP